MCMVMSQLVTSAQGDGLSIVARGTAFLETAIPEAVLPNIPKVQKLIAYGDISRILEGTIKKGSTDIKRPGCGDDVFKTQDASHDNCIWSRRPNIVRASLSSFNFPNALHMTCCV